jgi:hypothetical protein
MGIFKDLLDEVIGADVRASATKEVDDYLDAVAVRPFDEGDPTRQHAAAKPYEGAPTPPG